MRVLIAVFVLASSMLAQRASSVLRPRASTGTRAATGSRSTLVLQEDVIFPHIAFGGGWETQFVVVNMNSIDVKVKQPFYDTAGKPITVTYRSVPDGAVTTSDSAQFTLSPFGSYNIVLTDNGGSLQTGWSELLYSGSDSSGNPVQLGGSAIFRSRVAGRPDFEAVVPISSYGDWGFYLPFDNSTGYVTSMALLNPDFNSKTTVHLDFLDNQGNLLIDEQKIDLAEGQQTAFAITDSFSKLAGKVGVLYAWGESDYLSALGFRFNNAGGGAFATVPIMNWNCTFQGCQ